jgi:hypothetical protein
MKTVLSNPNLDFAELENTATNYKLTNISILLGDFRGNVMDWRLTTLSQQFSVLTVTEYNFKKFLPQQIEQYFIMLYYVL